MRFLPRTDGRLSHRHSFFSCLSTFLLEEVAALTSWMSASPCVISHLVSHFVVLSHEIVCLSPFFFLGQEGCSDSGTLRFNHEERYMGIEGPTSSRPDDFFLRFISGALWITFFFQIFVRALSFFSPFMAPVQAGYTPLPLSWPPAESTCFFIARLPYFRKMVSVFL